MTSIMSCKRCLVEWFGQIVKACWMCGKVGTVGPYVSEEGEPLPWGSPANSYPSATEPVLVL